MIGHTAGPWIVKRDWSDDPVEFQQEIFSVTSQDGSMEVSISGSYIGQDKRDAQLIAAAPDLLRSAEMVMIWWEAAQYETTGDRGEYNVFSGEPDFVAAARDAIAKAKGES